MVNGRWEFIRGVDARPIVFLSEPAFAGLIMIFTGAWKSAGYYAVLVLAAIGSIVPSIYEPASIDGTSRYIVGTMKVSCAA